VPAHLAEISAAPGDATLAIGSAVVGTCVGLWPGGRNLHRARGHGERLRTGNVLARLVLCMRT
jgi:hypothetical protein